MRIGTDPAWYQNLWPGLLHWALGPGEDWNNVSAFFCNANIGLHWALGPGEDWNGSGLVSKSLAWVVALGLRAW